MMFIHAPIDDKNFLFFEHVFMLKIYFQGTFILAFRDVAVAQ